MLIDLRNLGVVVALVSLCGAVIAHVLQNDPLTAFAGSSLFFALAFALLADALAARFSDKITPGADKGSST